MRRFPRWNQLENKKWRSRVDLSYVKSSTLKKKVMTVLEKNESVFGENMSHIRTIKHRILLKRNTLPDRIPPRRAGLEMREEVWKRLNIS